METNRSISYIVNKDDLILITGSSGFIGAKVVETLLNYGFNNLRAFVRPSSNLSRLSDVITRLDAKSKVEFVSGDLLSREDCNSAADGVRVVYHLAAGIEKSFAGAFMNSALATRNLVEAYLSQGIVTRFVNVSSFSVYSNFRMKRGQLLDENCPLESEFQDRNDAYGFGKLKQEQIVESFAKSNQLPYTNVRPGAVFGPGKAGVSGRVGIDTFGFFLHLGGSNRIPLTYVDNCAEAIVLAGLIPGVDGETFNIVDDDLPSSRKILKIYKRGKGGFFSLSLPYWTMNFLSKRWEAFFRKRHGQLPPVFNQRRCSAEWKGNRYSNEKLKQSLNWEPRVRMEDALESFGQQFLDN